MTSEVSLYKFVSEGVEEEEQPAVVIGVAVVGQGILPARYKCGGETGEFFLVFFLQAGFIEFLSGSHWFSQLLLAATG